jgi:transposase-like protein
MEVREMVAKGRRRHPAEFKFKVALEALKGEKTINEIASQYRVHPNLVGEWKQQLQERGPGVFQDKEARSTQESERLQTELYEQIGRLKMELEWLKKKAARFGGS